MLTFFGKALRTIRLERNLYLKDMANALNIEPSYLSSIENGKRNPTRSFLNKIISTYNLIGEERRNLEDAYVRTIRENSFKLNNAEPYQVDLSLALARKLDSLSFEQVQEIRRILREDG
ncbi:MAG: helix-turn-helix domain-containing protein [Oscillospiraceae bacterium]|jgi:transcriptional regulator with XRE-family HTH domain|nr:helix-turn-helix domain-containing protein [Oscillospiraceae bacterium]